MTSAYDLLLKFVINLLKPNRPSVWRSIMTDNTVFKARVACMKGYEDILVKVGYTEREEDILKFPEHVQEPDKTKLYVLAAELLMAKLEVDQMNNATQQQQQQEATCRRQSHHGAQITSTTHNSQEGHQFKGYSGQQCSVQEYATATAFSQEQSLLQQWQSLTPRQLKEQHLSQQQLPYQKSQSCDPQLQSQPPGQEQWQIRDISPAKPTNQTL